MGVWVGGWGGCDENVTVRRSNRGIGEGAGIGRGQEIGGREGLGLTERCMGERAYGLVSRPDALVVTRNKSGELGSLCRAWSCQ